jgi:hypothetical protein
MLLKLVVAKQGMTAEVGSLSCGWFSPLEVQAIHVTGQEPELEVNVSRVGFERSWPSILLNAPHVGHISVQRPEIDLVLDRMEPPPPATETTADRRRGLPWTLSAAVEDASIRVRTSNDENAVIALDDLDLCARIVARQSGNGENGRVLQVDPVTVLAQQDVTAELCNQGLQLVAPVLADAMHVEGRVTLELADFSLPLDIVDPQEQAQKFQVRGSLRFDEVRSGIKNPLLQELSRLISQVLNIQTPQTLEIADDTEVAFEVREGRVYHEGLAFFLPELSREMVWRTRGAVGLDESLDLTVEAQLPLNLIHDGPLFRQLSENPLLIHVTGDLKHPQLSLDEGGGWIQKLIDAASGGLARDATDDRPEEQVIVDSILGLVDETLRGMRSDNERSRSESEARPLTLLERLRERRRFREEEAAQAAEENGDEPASRLRLFPGRLFRRPDADEQEE